MHSGPWALICEFCERFGAFSTTAAYFYKREFTLTLLGDVYIRYNCYANAAEFSESSSLKVHFMLNFALLCSMDDNVAGAGKALVSKVPEKIDIGPVYTAPVREDRALELIVTNV
jgi:hypothetical protein